MIRPKIERLVASDLGVSFSYYGLNSNSGGLYFYFLFFGGG